MRIYRFLALPEYECFLKRKSLLDVNSTWATFQASRMLFPENCDRYGKFFFFELEDAFQFARFYDNCSEMDKILELDIDPETALKFLSVAPYTYPDPPRDEYGPVEHYIPELYLNHRYVDEKIQRGEYRLISPTLELRGFPKDIYDSNRTPGFVELGKVLNKIIPIKNSLSGNMLWSWDREGLEELGIDEFKRKKAIMSVHVSFIKAEKIKRQLDTIAKEKFRQFVREHEKYLALIPVEERQPI